MRGAAAAHPDAELAAGLLDRPCDEDGGLVSGECGQFRGTVRIDARDEQASIKLPSSAF
jgi:hypothetical protein